MVVLIMFPFFNIDFFFLMENLDQGDFCTETPN